MKTFTSQLKSIREKRERKPDWLVTIEGMEDGRGKYDFVLEILLKEKRILVACVLSKKLWEELSRG